MQSEQSIVNEFEVYERARRRFLFWLLWVLANTLGIAGGWAMGEALGQTVGQKYGWTLGIRAAWVVFEVIIWLARGSVLLYMREISTWRVMDTVVWLAGEFIGELFGEGNLAVNGPVWLTAGAVFGTIGGAGFWLTLWLMIHRRRPRKWNPLLTAARAFIGLVGGSALFGLVLALAFKLGDWARAGNQPFVGWALSGALVGALVGVLTGFAYLGLLRWQLRRPVTT